MATAQKRKPKPPAALEKVLSLEALQRLGGPTTFERGKNYFEDGRVEILACEEGRLKARVRGTQPYRVEMWAERKALHAFCSCPADSAFCKHAVAASLAWLEEGQSEGAENGGSKPEGLRDFLVGQEKEDLVDLLFDHAFTDDRLYRRLMFEQAKTGLRRPNLAAVRRNLAAIFDSGDVHSYWEVRGFATGLNEAVDALENMLKGHAEELVDLTEYAISLTEEVLEQVDDSNGEVSAVLERLQDLHLEACKKAKTRT
jgi:uncharacterized Zn finger protein